MKAVASPALTSEFSFNTEVDSTDRNSEVSNRLVKLTTFVGLPRAAFLAKDNSTEVFSGLPLRHAGHIDSPDFARTARRGGVHDRRILGFSDC